MEASDDADDQETDVYNAAMTALAQADLHIAGNALSSVLVKFAQLSSPDDPMKGLMLIVYIARNNLSMILETDPARRADLQCTVKNGPLRELLVDIPERKKH